MMTWAHMAFLGDAHVAVDTLRAAAELDLLAQLGEPLRAEELASRKELDPRGTRLLLLALCELGLVARVGELFHATAGPRLLEARVETSLADRVRGQRPPPDDGNVRTAETYRATVPILGESMAVVAEQVARQLRGAKRVADLGAGAAPWSLALAEQEGSCHVTAVDLAAVLETTRDCVKRRGCDAQYAFRAADLFEHDIGDGYDLVLLGNVCHLFGESANRLLFSKARDALVPRGRLAVVDFVRTEQPPRSQLMHEVSLYRRTVAGAHHDLSNYTSWVRDAGFEDVSITALSGPPEMSLIAARRAD